MQCLVAPVLSEESTGPSRPSGHDKRRAKNQLPAPYLIYDHSERCIHGACVVVEVLSVTSGSSQDVAWWHTCRPVRCATPFTVEKEMVAYHGSVFLLVGSAEARVRMWESALGGPLALQFPEFHEKHFKCLRVDTRVMRSIFGDSSPHNNYLCLLKTTIRAAGVVPTVVAELPNLDGSSAAEELCTFPVAHEGHDAQPSSHNVIADIDHNLKALSVDQRGIIAHRYTAEASLSFLELCQHLKPSAEVNKVLGASARILLGPGPGTEMVMAGGSHGFDYFIASLRSCTSENLQVLLSKATAVEISSRGFEVKLTLPHVTISRAHQHTQMQQAAVAIGPLGAAGSEGSGSATALTAEEWVICHRTYSLRSG